MAGIREKSIWFGMVGLMALLPQSAGADTYTYDVQGRLIQVVFTSGGTATYTYDSAGNRTVVYQH